MLHNDKHEPAQTFLRCVSVIRLKMNSVFHKMVHFLSSNMWIKYGFMGFTNYTLCFYWQFTLHPNIFGIGFVQEPLYLLSISKIWPNQNRYFKTFYKVRWLTVMQTSQAKQTKLYPSTQSETKYLHFVLVSFASA